MDLKYVDRASHSAHKDSYLSFKYLKLPGSTSVEACLITAIFKMKTTSDDPLSLVSWKY